MHHGGVEHSSRDTGRSAKERLPRPHTVLLVPVPCHDHSIVPYKLTESSARSSRPVSQRQRQSHPWSVGLARRLKLVWCDLSTESLLSL